jgi:DNA-binding NtrC family response regulator
VLQEREVVPVGEHKPFPVDLRVCSATHRDLDALVEAGQFRRDLQTRLQGHQLRLPSLAQRLADLGLITRALIRRLAGANADRVTIEPRAFRAMCRYHWPGNIRELEKTLTVALALCAGDSISLDHLPRRLTGESSIEDSRPPAEARTPSEPKPPLAAACGGEPESAQADAEALAQLTQLLARHHGNVAAVGRALGKHPFQIYRWVKRWNLDLKQFREPGST